MERLAPLRHWDKETGAARLGSLLQGKALDMYNGLADGEVGSTASLEQGNWGYPAGVPFAGKGARRVQRVGWWGGFWLWLVGESFAGSLPFDVRDLPAEVGSSKKKGKGGYCSVCCCVGNFLFPSVGAEWWGMVIWGLCGPSSSGAADSLLRLKLLQSTLKLTVLIGRRMVVPEAD